MAGEVRYIKGCTPLKLRSGLTGKYHALPLLIVCQEAAHWHKIVLYPLFVSILIRKENRDKPSFSFFVNLDKRKDKTFLRYHTL